MGNEMEQETPSWVTNSNLMWHSDPSQVPQEEPGKDLQRAWQNIEDPIARAMLQRRFPHVRFPGETFEQAWFKLFGEKSPHFDGGWHLNNHVAMFDGGDAAYFLLPKGRIVVMFVDGCMGISKLQNGEDF